MNHPERGDLRAACHQILHDRFRKFKDAVPELVNVSLFGPEVTPLIGSSIPRWRVRYVALAAILRC